MALATTIKKKFEPVWRVVTWQRKVKAKIDGLMIEVSFIVFNRSIDNWSGHVNVNSIFLDCCTATEKRTANQSPIKKVALRLAFTFQPLFITNYQTWPHYDQALCLFQLASSLFSKVLNDQVHLGIFFCPVFFYARTRWVSVSEFQSHTLDIGKNTFLLMEKDPPPAWNKCHLLAIKY